MILALLLSVQEWPGFMGPARDGKSPEKGLVTPWPAGGPRVVWSRPLGESFGAPSVAAGKLFHFDRFGGAARLSCVKSATGEELWKFEYPVDYADRYSDNHGPRCSPVIDGEHVYLFGVEGTLHCLKVADGAVVWKKDTTAEFGVVQNFFGVGSTPLVEGDLLIALVGGTDGIVAFDKRTGAVKYKITEEQASYSSPVAATIAGRRWCFVHARGALVGFDPAAGKVDFQHPWRARETNSVNVSTPVVVGDTVFISEAYSVGAALLKVKPGGCEVVWSDGRRRDRALPTWWTTALHVDGHLYASAGLQGEDPELRCVELATGKVRWSAPGLGPCAMLYVDGHFVAVNESGLLRLIKVSPERYIEVSSSAIALIKSPARAAPILSHGLLYVRGRDRLVCLEAIK